MVEYSLNKLLSYIEKEHKAWLRENRPVHAAERKAKLKHLKKVHDKLLPLWSYAKKHKI